MRLSPSPWCKRTRDPRPRACLGATAPSTLKRAVPDADDKGRMPRLVLSAGCSVVLARRLRCQRAQAHADVPVDRRRPGWPLDSLPPKDDSIPAFRQQQYERWLRAEIARLRRSPTVEASLRVARLERADLAGNSRRSLRKDWARANTTVAELSGVRARTELGYVIGTVRTLAAAHLLTADRLRPGVPRPAREHALLGDRADPGVRLPHQPGHRPGDLPVLPGARDAAPAAGVVGPRQRDRRRLPGRAAQPHQARHVPPRAMRARAWTGCRSLGARRSGYLAWEYYFAYGTGDAAVGERDDAGDRDPGALARLPRDSARHAGGAPRSRRWARSSARRRRASRCRVARRTPLRSCTRSRRRTSSSTAACRP